MTDDYAGQQDHHSAEDAPESTPAAKAGNRPTKIIRRRQGKFSRLLTAGKSGSILRFSASKLPKPFMAIHKQINALRDAIETACVERHGSVSVPRMALINSICRAETAARVVERLFRVNDGQLDPEQQAAMQERLVRLTEKRDAAIRKLDLDGGSNPSDRWQVLDTKPTKGATK